MRGDVVVIEEHHRKAASEIVPKILEQIMTKTTRYTITVSGESGSGKSETGSAVAERLAKHGIKAVVIGQDDYFVLPPKSNDARRRQDPEWLGPHVEVKLDLMEANLADAVAGKGGFTKPLIDYDRDSVEDEFIDLAGVKVVIAEGTYTALLKHVDTKIFIARNRIDTLAHRQKRNRGNEVGDPFTEQVLITEHKIIAGHAQLADFLITKDYGVLGTAAASVRPASRAR